MSENEKNLLAENEKAEIEKAIQDPVLREVIILILEAAGLLP
nr:MAG TPA: hypothetical protein [Caudoviricetes sp.]